MEICKRNEGTPFSRYFLLLLFSFYRSWHFIKCILNRSWILLLKTFLYLLLLLLVASLITKYLAIKVNVKDDLDTEKNYVNKWHKWVEKSFYVVFIILFIAFEQVPMWVMLIIFCLCYLSFWIFMEWRYNRETREYLLSFSLLIYFLIAIIIGAILNVF